MDARGCAVDVSWLSLTPIYKYSHSGTRRRFTTNFDCFQKRFPVQSIGTILCAEHCCCLSSLLSCWAQSWTGRHSNAGYSNGSIIPVSWYSFCRPQKDDRLSQPHLVLIQQPTLKLTPGKEEVLLYLNGL